MCKNWKKDPSVFLTGPVFKNLSFMLPSLSQFISPFFPTIFFLLFEFMQI